MSQISGLSSNEATGETGAHTRAAGFGALGAAQPPIMTSLSLNLILLAFFVVLNGASQFDAVRVAAVLDGVQSKFGLVTPVESAGQVAVERRAAARDALRDSVSAAFATVLSGRELALTSRADRIDVIVPNAVLFEGENESLRPVIPLLTRLASVLTQPADGLRYELMISADLAGDRDRVASAIGNVAAGLISRGVPAALLSAGRIADQNSVLKPRGDFVFSFLVLDVSDPLPVAILTEEGAQ